MVRVDVHVGQHVDELSSLEACRLGDQTGEKGVAGDIERHPQTHIAASLVHYTVELA